MKVLGHSVSLDDALFILILAVPVVFAVAEDMNIAAEKSAIILAHQPVKNANPALAAKAKTDVARTDVPAR